MSTFQWLTKQSVESSAGFALLSRHQHYYHYIEAGKTLKVPVDPGTDKDGRYYEQVYGSLLKRWEPPHDSTELSAAERDRIKANIGEALKFMSIGCEWA